MRTCLARVPRVVSMLALLLALSPSGWGFQEPEKKTQDQDSPTAEERFTQAKKLASRNRKRVLMMWTSAEERTSKDLGELFRRHRELAQLVRNEFEMVRVSGDTDSEESALARRLEVDLTGGLPAVTVFNAKGKLMAHQPAQAWFGDGKLDPELVIATLERLKVTPQDAEQVLQRGLAAAAKKDQHVLVHLGAPW